MEKEEKLNKLLLDLESNVEELIQLGKQNFDAHTGFYTFDIFCTGLLNKSVNIIRGYVSQIRDNNFLTAAPLVRIHLDSLMRFFAPQIINDNIDEYAHKIIKGVSVRNMKDRDGNNLTDSYLVKKMGESKSFIWVPKLYKVGCSYVHFSERAIFSSIKIEDGTRTMSGVIGKHDDFINLDEKIGSAIYMRRITDGIKYFLISWIEQKKSYPKE